MMSKRRIIFIPQYPAKLRYQEWWITEFEKHLSQEFEVLTLKGSNTTSETRKGQFSPINAAIDWELEQIKQYMSLELRTGDILLFNDISFPGFFAQALYHKKPFRVYAICHATSLNYLDYFSRSSYSKSFVEGANIKYLDGLIVGSQYHKRKLQKELLVPHSTPIHVLQLPFPPIKYQSNLSPENRTNYLVSVARDCSQKVDFIFERLIKNNFACGITLPGEKDLISWQTYYHFLQNSSFMVITSKEETFGYQIIDAYLNGVIPIAPRRYSYPELLSKHCLYHPGNITDFKLKIIEASVHDYDSLFLFNKEETFYDNLIKILNQ